MYRHYPLTARGRRIDVYDYIQSAATPMVLQEIQRVLSRMPAQHLAAVYPIFVVEHKPRREPGGGTWTPRVVRNFMGHTRDTGVPDADVALLASIGNGLIAIPRDRWERTGVGALPTVMHEVGHSVDATLGLVPRGASPHSFPGVRPECGGAGMARYAVEAYARFIVNPSTVARDPAGDRTVGECTRTAVASLRQSPAFRMLPATWMPGQ